MDPLFRLKSDFAPAGDQPEAIAKLKAGLEAGLRAQTLLGVTGSGKTFTIANVISELNKPILVIAPNKALAAQLYREYKNFFPDNAVHYFVSYYDYYQPEAYLPVTDTYIDKEAMINDELDRLRHGTTAALLSRRDVIVVASVSCIYNLGVPDNYLEARLHLSVGQALVRSDLIKQLVRLQFKRVVGNIDSGQFRVRGDIIEIRPMAEKVLYRIELARQEINRLEILDDETRQIKEELKEIVLFPPKHFISTQPQIDNALTDIKEELLEREQYFKNEGLFLEAERIGRRTRYDLEMIKTIGYCHGIENYSRHLSGKRPGEAPDSLLAYFPKDKDGQPDFLTIIDESHITIPQIRGMYNGDQARKKNLIQYGWRLPSALDNRPLKFKEFEERVGQMIFTTATPGEYEKIHSQKIIEQVIRPTGLVDPEIEIRPVFDREKNRTQINDLEEEMATITAAGGRVLVNTLTKKQAEDLHAYLTKKGVRSNYLHSDVKTFARTEVLKDFRQGVFDVLIGVNLLREGLDLPEVVLVAILDADREGFLRSETSLMQTMGRAARNVSGRIILYADQLTDSIKKATAIVASRREKQLAYNKKHQINPKTIQKPVEDFLDFVPTPDAKTLKKGGRAPKKTKQYGR
ncbi:MAG: excinuclease ABC subunit UvrB [Patescibacteria group bacterium]|jgi:excinuclease ABC subunit B